MSVKIGNANIADIKIGDIMISKVYKGTDLVYQKNNQRRLFTIDLSQNLFNQKEELSELFKCAYKFKTYEDNDFIEISANAKVNGQNSILVIGSLYNTVVYVSNVYLKVNDTTIFSILLNEALNIKDLIDDFINIFYFAEQDGCDLIVNESGILNIEILNPN